MELYKKYKAKITGGRAEKIMFWIAVAVFPLFAAVVPDIITGPMDNGLFAYIFSNAGLYLLSYLIILLVHFALTLLFTRTAISMLVLSIFSVCVGIINSNKISYREEPLFVSDIYHIGGVTETIETGLTVSIGFMPILLLTIGIILSLLYFPIKNPILTSESKKTLFFFVRLAVSAASVAAALFFINGVIYDESLTEKLGRTTHAGIVEEFEDNTFYFELVATTETLFPKKPAGYNADSMAALGEEIAESGAGREGRRADIIVLQVETWFELDNYDVAFEENPFEILDAIKDEGISGYMIPPKYGGGTAYMEFEMLTGLSSGDTQAAACPFNAVMYDNFPSAVQYFAANGYGTAAVHAFNNSMYNRANAYPMLGFEGAYFDDTFENPTRLGEWIDDDSCVDKIIELYEKGIEQKDNVFIHALTMQNHSPLFASRYSRAELEGVLTSDTLDEEQQLAVAAYAESFRKTNEAIVKLTDYFRNSDREVILVIYGDHQAAITVEGEQGEILSQTGYLDNYSEEEDFFELHSTPYIVWDNLERETETESFGNVAPNMLLVNALCEYDILRPNYFDYFYANSSSMNGTTSNYVIDKDGEIRFSMTPEQQAEYAARELIQYDLIYAHGYLKDYIY